MPSFRYAVTFELPETAPPLTIRGTVTGGQAQTLARRAVVDAKRQALGKHWTSLVILIERVTERETSAQDAHGTSPAGTEGPVSDAMPAPPTPDMVEPSQPEKNAQTGGLEDD